MFPLATASSIWFGAVIRGDVAPVVIGQRVNVQDNAVVHCDTGVTNTIEDDVTIGHGAIVHGKHVGAGFADRDGGDAAEPVGDRQGMSDRGGGGGAAGYGGAGSAWW